MSAQDNSKSSKKNRRLNIWIIILGCILAYLIVYSCIFLFGNSDTLYEVTEGSTAADFDEQHTAFIIRSEKVIETVESGYINYIAGDTSRVHVGQQIYAVDKTGALYDALSAEEESRLLLNEEDMLGFKEMILDFDTSFSTDNYSAVYSTKYKINSQLTDVVNTNALNNIEDKLKAAEGINYTIYTSDYSGTIVHSIDGYENYTVDKIDAAAFRMANYKRTVIDPTESAEAGTPVYKIISSDSWKLVFQLDNVKKYEGVSEFDVEIISDHLDTTADFETFTSAGSSYGVLSLDRYCQNYAAERFLQIRIHTDTEKGLKVPTSAVTEKQFSKLPTSYITKGGDSGSEGFMVLKKQSDGSLDGKFVAVNIAASDDGYYYVSTDEIDTGSIIQQEGTNEQYSVDTKVNLQGVYVVNNSVSTFKVVEPIGVNGDYTIVRSDSTYGLRIYDRILTNAKDA